MNEIDRSLRTLAGLPVMICVAALSLGCSPSERPSQAGVAPEPQIEPQPGPNFVFLNGKVLTVDEDFSVAEAVAVTGNRISAVGSSDELAALAGENTQVIDLEGRHERWQRAELRNRVGHHFGVAIPDFMP